MKVYNGNAAVKMPRNQATMTYEEFEDIYNGFTARRRNRAAKDREKRMKYYRRQKLFGAVIMAVGGIFLGIGHVVEADVMEYFGAAVGFVGLYIIMTRQMVLVDKYYLEVHDRLNEF